MQKIKHKFWVLLAGVAMFAAVFLLTGMASGTQASAASAEEVCVHEYGDGIVHCPIALRADTRNTSVRSAARVIGIITRTERSTPIRKSWYNPLARTRAILRTFVPSAGMSTRTIIPPRSVMIIRTK